MNAIFSQAGRRGRLSTVLGEDVLVLLRMDGSEELSGDFAWRVEALCVEGGLDLEPLLGTHATVEIETGAGVRPFDGIVCEAEARGADENGWRYDLVLRPWLHVAALRRNMRIFHSKTVIQIVEEVLSDYADLGDPHLEVAVSDDYPVLEYTVQYGESDADFVRRQLERHGISWGWAHAAGSHTMTLVDYVDALPALPGGARPYRPVDGHHMAEGEHFRTWHGGRRITTGAVRLTEYNFKTPRAVQEVHRLGDGVHPRGDVESYDWPGDYLEQAQGRGVVARRVEEERGAAPRHRAEGDVAGLGAGTRVTVTGDEVPGVTGRGFVCLSAVHRFRAQAYGTGDAGGDERAYDGAYVLIPDDAPLRPERRTPAPKVAGPETAVVVGEGEIDCDEHGRILARFYWDDAGAHTMRMRVSQNWASKGWGGMVIPRIGMEVIVEHLRGDPDHPIVTGCVYNGANTPPYELPKHKTRSTFRTDTHRAHGFNELRFEDESGREEIFVHAQKDRNEKIRHNHTERIDNNFVQSVGHNRASEVDNNSDDVVGGNMTLSVGPTYVGNVNGGASLDYWQGMGSVGVEFGERGRSQRGEGNLSIRVQGTAGHTIDRHVMYSVGQRWDQQIGRDMGLDIGTHLDVAVGGNHVDSAGGKRIVQAAQKIELVCGRARLALHSDGRVQISGRTLNLSFGERIALFTNAFKARAARTFAVLAGRIDLN
ncbi:type VI secretion system tip protein VgrG [Jannaschia sp. Os4]|uniref:type VI secretion system Vgr family protein n=1 Tax=Jannaschia sp. Os4 TaxID=2807617 RepID=UPI001939A368|nr:type VI secretion system tip protein TssI/VgrG [Jannaschia sp. Os4]MBM2575330.1 type VI secretion system tip protein VgrG [Jannaschia sp. Os4]